MKSNPSFIQPTVGRKVWFWLNRSVVHGSLVHRIDESSPMDATIVFVHPDSPFVNLLVVDHLGKTFPVINAYLRQAGEHAPDISAYCEWMPYQQTQAAKATAENTQQARAARATTEQTTKGSAEQAAPPATKPAEAYRLTPDDINDVIVKVAFTILADGRTTVCQLELKNGFTVTGASVASDSRHYNSAIGRKLAYDTAVEAVWPLEAYLQRQRVYETRDPKFDWIDSLLASLFIGKKETAAKA